MATWVWVSRSQIPPSCLSLSAEKVKSSPVQRSCSLSDLWPRQHACSHKHQYNTCSFHPHTNQIDYCWSIPPPPPAINETFIKQMCCHAGARRPLLNMLVRWRAVAGITEPWIRPVSFLWSQHAEQSDWMHYGLRRSAGARPNQHSKTSIKYIRSQLFSLQTASTFNCTIPFIWWGCKLFIEFWQMNWTACNDCAMIVLQIETVWRTLYEYVGGTVA